MIRHLFVAALRNMAANKLLSAISILGLAMGMAAAILAGLVVRNEITYDHFLPGYERTYLIVSSVYLPLTQSDYGTSTDARMADLLRLNVPEIENVILVPGVAASLKHGQIASKENVYWGPPSFYSVLPFPVLYGDAAGALAHPDGVMLTRATAEKYFGRDNVVGQAIDVDGHPMIVRAVIQDLPPHGTTFTWGGWDEALDAFSTAQGPVAAAFISSLASFAPKPHPLEKGQFPFSGQIFLRLRPGASLANVNRAVSRLYATLVSGPGKQAYPALGQGRQAFPVRIDHVHLLDDLNPGVSVRIAAGAAIGMLILFIACANFVNLSVARAARRHREVSVRKASGASRSDLMRQFIGEAFVSVAVAAAIAVVLVEWLLPATNAFLETGATFDYGRDPMLALVLLLAIMLVGLAAGAYPALVLSAFKPANVLKGWTGSIIGTGIIRSSLVAAQFAILVILILVATVVYQQYNYASREALRVNIDQVLIVKKGCSAAFLNGIKRLPGVRGAACANDAFLDGLEFVGHPYRGRILILNEAEVDFDLFALYGVTPVAGSLQMLTASQRTAPGVVINQTAAKELGYSSPQAALGHQIWQYKPWDDLRIVAVIPDFSFHSVASPTQPMVFPDVSTDPSGAPDDRQKYDVHIRLRGQQIPESLNAIDRLWKTTGGNGPINRFFLGAHMQERYVSLLRQAQMYALFAGIAVFLACLGLIGIAVSAAERRTKEIGIRKAAGASNRDIIWMLLWQFARPVLSANIVAWPLAWWLMNRWLSGFGNHVDLHAWLFPAASAAALSIALATVAGQAFLVARQKPVLALRYE